jgi:hypothetical protein
LGGKPEGKRPSGRPRRGCEYSTKMDLREIKCEIVYWIQLAGDKSPVVKMIVELRFP